MAASSLAVLVLAAGAGTRMKSGRPKVLHEIAGASLIAHVLATAQALAPERLAVVTAAHMSDVRAAAAPAGSVIQDSPRGTGHAVLAARDFLDGFRGEVLVLFGDTPLLMPRTLENLVATLRGDESCAVAVLGMELDEPGAYGRLVTGDDGGLHAIIEAKDASPEEARIRLCNSGVMAFDGSVLFDYLAKLSDDNAKGEYYLTDLVAIARAAGRTCRVVMAEDPEELLGVNSRADLALVESVWQWRRRGECLSDGVTLTDPASVFFSFDTELAADVSVEPHVVFGPGVSVAEGARIRAFSHLEGARVAAGAVIGPYARLRPGAVIGQGARVGNFVEVKNAELQAGAKANHLSYIGDAEIGANANIGAGTITCNYDGFGKSKTVIGAGAFIGSNTALVAPVTIGRNTIVGAGSVVTKDVPDDALAVARGQQKTFPDKARQIRAERAAGRGGNRGGETE
ncbi:MAG: bifunctional UDP-N-acetylglucosamine diphosphorylase/glucosamine-1-phosphate N-acetyltransferase GlmU [Alphaproteobacteria bacterium]